VQLNLEVAGESHFDEPQRAVALRLLVGWKMTIETSGDIDSDQDDREIVMTTLAQVYQELLEQEREAERRGLEQGMQAGERSLILRQLTRRVGPIPETMQASIRALPLAQLEELGEALLDFTQLADLQNWLQAQSGVEPTD
jgi:hypothetical protein